MDKKYLQKICFNCRYYRSKLLNGDIRCYLGKFVNLKYPFTCKDYSNKYYMTKEKTMQYKEKNNGNNNKR